MQFGPSARTPSSQSACFTALRNRAQERSDAGAGIRGRGGELPIEEERQRMDHELVVVLITTGDEQEAELVATALLQSRLAACVNLLPGLTSLYWWEGRIDRSEEVLLLAKTRRELVPML